MRKWIKIIFSLFFLFAFVIVAIIFLAIFLELEILWLILIIEVISLIFCIFLFCSNRRDEVKLSWIIFIIFVPFIGILSYFFFGRKFKYEEWEDKYYQQLLNKLNSDYQVQTINYVHHLETIQADHIKVYKYGTIGCHRPVYLNNEVKLIPSGPETWIQIFQDLQKAEEYVLLTYYILADGELFQHLKQILLQLLARGVRVYLIFDYAGSFHKISGQQLRDLERAGMKYRVYAAQKMPFINRNVNYRNHRKDVVIDGKIGYVGGINLGDDFINLSATFGVFHDQQIRIVGDSVQGIELAFIKDWYFASKQRDKITDYEPGLLTRHKTYPYTTEVCEENSVMLFDNGPEQPDSVAKEVFLNLISNAKHRVWIATPYFIPPREIVEAIKIAARSGVDVRLLIPGITDKMFILDITRYKCRELFTAGVKIYELNETFSHSKIALIDDVAIGGSTNLDYRALYSDQQTMIVVQSAEVVKQFEDNWEWSFDHAIKWERYIMEFKSPLYLNFLKLMQIISPIL